jgi:predicted Zn-dependent peptidase
VAKKYLTPDNIQIVAVGEAAKIKPVLEKTAKSRFTTWMAR